MEAGLLMDIVKVIAGLAAGGAAVGTVMYRKRDNDDKDFDLKFGKHCSAAKEQDRKTAEENWRRIEGTLADIRQGMNDGFRCVGERLTVAEVRVSDMHEQQREMALKLSKTVEELNDVKHSVNGRLDAKFAELRKDIRDTRKVRANDDE